MGYSVVQSKSASSSSALPSVTLSSAPTTGNKIIVGISGSQAVTTVQDGNGNNLTQVGIKLNTDGGTQSTYIYAYDVPATPSTVFNTTATTNPYGSVLVQEVSGLLAGNTTTMLDGSAVGLQGSTSVLDFTTGSPAYSSSVVNEYLISIFGDWGTGATATQPTGYTIDANSQNTSGFADCCIAYKNSTGGSEASSWSVHNPNTALADFWATITVAFKLGGFAQASRAPVRFPMGV